jgi:hypothetical protein
MKLGAAVALVVAILCSSTLAVAEGPVPFRALMRNEGAQSGIPPLTDVNDQPAATSNQAAHKTHMTRTGKIMTGVGIGMVAIGGVVMAVTPHAFATPTDKNELYGASGATMGVGVVLIVIGVTRHSAQ